MNKKDISKYPFSNVDSSAKVEELLAKHIELYEGYDWVLPQLQAKFVEEVKPVKVGDKYCALATLKGITDPFIRGLWFYAKTNFRSSIVAGRLYKEPNFGSLVPILLSAYKTYSNIPYSSWSRETLHYMVDPQLCEAMLYEPTEEISVESWLDLRSWGLKIRSGKRIGESRDPRSCASLYSLSTYEGFDTTGIPKLALVMYTQIWCAHPANRSPHMVLDPSNWDAMPVPLISTEIFQPAQDLGAKSTQELIPPWDPRFKDEV